MQINSTSASAYPSAYDRTVSNRKLTGNASDYSQDAAASGAQDTVDISPAATQAYEADAEPSTPKLLLYGALGLQRPDATNNKPADGYDVGRWIAAGVEAGMVLSVLI